MVLTVHLLTGAAIATKIQPAPLAFLLAFLSHFLLDFIFHRDYPINYIKTRIWRYALIDFTKIGLDLACGTFLIFLFSKNFVLAITGGFLAILPDGLTLLFLVLPKSKILANLYDFHCQKLHYFSKNKRISLFWEILSQIVVSLVAIYFLR
jgi:hypothetical protein